MDAINVLSKFLR